MRKSLFELAIEITGYDRDHLTEHQENEISALVQFGERVLDNAAAQPAADRGLVCPECDSRVMDNGYCMMGHWVGKPLR